MKKNNMMDYIAWRGDLSFECDPFSEVDSLVLSQLSYIDLTDIADGELPESAVSLFDAVTEYEMLPDEKKYLGAIIPKETLPLASAASRSKRFGDVEVFGFENIIDEAGQSQFCALTYILPTGEAVVAFRGTDDTLVGWKENLNMSFLTETAAQAHAVEYLSEIGEKTGGRRIYVCGHSKGGNLAVWASVNAKADISARISAVYNHDGPGFSQAFFTSEKYKKISERIFTFIPQFSIVGIFFEHDGKAKTVKSTSNTIMSHDPFSWQILGRRILCADRRTAMQKRSDDAINSWIASLSAEQRRQFVDTLYTALSESGVKTLSDINNNKLKTLVAFRRAMKNLDEDEERNMRYVLGKIINKNLTLEDIKKADKG